jgi:starch phosphorylase
MENAVEKFRISNKDEIRVAYFSMEIGFHGEIPTYSGGLGVLAGDTLRSCADLEVPILGVTLVSNKGYFIQKFDDDDNQIEQPYVWDRNKYFTELRERVTVKVAEKVIYIKAWKYDLKGVTGHIVPIFLLDTNIIENDEEDRHITDCLYGGDKCYRFLQEIILGIGGYRMLKKLGYYDIEKYHMNEGHSALLTLELRKDLVGQSNWDMFNDTIEKRVHNRCVFTTHTPVPAGHDKFKKELVEKFLRGYLTQNEIDAICENDNLNLTLLALNSSKYVNGVAKKHSEVSREMFPGYNISSITNGIHSAFWTSPATQDLFDKYLKGWRNDPYTLRSVFSIPPDEIWNAHCENKKRLFEHIKEEYGVNFNLNSFTIGFARRITAYKRPYMFFTDIERIKKIVESVGPIQVIFAGKAHPNDTEGKKIIRKIRKTMKELSETINVIYLENYDIPTAQLLIPGVDIWLNNPQPPKEASGTSGMKASVNGVPNLSILDGWWLEGHVEDVTGWSIGEREMIYKNIKIEETEELETLYSKLETKIIPTYYEKRKEWLKIMQNTIGFNGSFFSTHRMVYQYVLSAYFD